MRRAAVLLAIALGALLYLTNLSAMGLVSVDEPRYAAIAQAMAASGDWVTPRLWGSPWFEKPALLYWLAGLGYKAGLGPELAPRLPVALFSLAFLGVFWFRLRHLWGERAAWHATAILGTSAGWLAYSHVAITDVPFAATFVVAVLWSVEERLTVRDTSIAGAALGLAVLAKSLPALVLFAPVLVLQRRHWRALVHPAPVAIFLGVALPWHLLCYSRNGWEFVRVLFVEHQLGRFGSGALQHVQPFWFYVPVLLMLGFPWFPLAGYALRGRGDSRVRILLAVAGFGFVFFSASVNKLPHYVLPLLPLLAAATGVGLAGDAGEEPARGKWRVPVCTALLGLLPAAAVIVPEALARGLRASSPVWAAVGVAAALWLGGGAMLGWVLVRRLPGGAMRGAAAAAGLAFLWFQYQTLPAIDRSASARSMWLKSHPDCVQGEARYMVYGLSYYANKALPPCRISGQVLDPQGDSIVR